MKPFFGKQVIEAPRRGSSSRGIKMRRIGKMIDGEYYGPTRIPMSMGGKAHAWGKKDYEEKSFSDVLGPINGYLRSAVGRRWDEVYSELCQNLGKFSWPLRHILTAHVDVATKTYRGVDGNVWSCDKSGGHTKLTGGYTAWRDEYYVEPETGILRAVKPSPRSRRRYFGNEPKKTERVLMADGRSAVLINSIWYIGSYDVALDPIKPGCFVTKIYAEGAKFEFKVVHYEKARPVAVPAEWPDYRQGDGRMVFTKQKQANKKELREIRKLRHN